MSYFILPLPLYSLLTISIFFGICFGFIFKDMLEYQINQWNSEGTVIWKLNANNPDLIAAYLGFSVCLIVFMSAGLAVFAIPPLFALGVGVVIVTPTMLLLWIQLGSMLRLYVEGGFEAINIEIQSEPED